MRKFARLAALAAAAAAVLATSAAAETVAPLPESDYAARAACPPPGLGFAGCMALQLIPVTAEARRRRHPLGIVRDAPTGHAATLTPAGGFLGLRPQDLHAAYSLPASAPGPQTIALVDAYNDPTAEEDLSSYDKEFGLPACTTANKCFTRIGQSGSERESELPFPKSRSALQAALIGTAPQRTEAREAIGWGVEISLDLQSAHAVCQSCQIVLVEANTPATRELAAAEREAETRGANEISNSWGTPEEGVGSVERERFDHPGTVIAASAGDSGYREWDGSEGEFTSFPASDPAVIAVGGTRLRTLGIGGGWQGETVWNGAGASGGGCSTIFAAPSWQQEVPDWGSVGCGSRRAANDVSADADPYTGVVIRDTDLPGKECQEEYEQEGVTQTLPEWCTVGGTSLASPIVASVFALAGGANGVAYPAQTLYSALRHTPAELHDVTTGSNGACGTEFQEQTGLSSCSETEEAQTSCFSKLACLAAPGYDGPSGVGTPDGVLGFRPGGVEAGETKPPAPASTAAASAPVATVVAKPLAPAPTIVELSALGLTNSAVIALDRRPTSAKVSYAVTANMPTQLRVTLARRVRSRGRWRWAAVGRTLTASLAAGRNVKRLTGGERLARGLYRLTLTPSTGRPRSLVFHIG